MLKKAKKLAGRFAGKLIAKEAAIATWLELKKILPPTPHKKAAVQAALNRVRIPRPPGSTAMASIVARLSTWKVRVKVTDEKGRSSRAAAGEGWVTTDEHRNRFYVTKSFKKLHVDIINDAIKRLKKPVEGADDLKEAFNKKDTEIRNVVEPLERKRLTQGFKFNITHESFPGK